MDDTNSDPTKNAIETTASSDKPSERVPWVKWSVAAVIVIVIVTLTVLFRGQLSLHNLARYETQLRDY